MSEVRKFSGVQLVNVGKLSGNDFSNVVGRTGSDVVFTQFNLTVGDPSYGDGSTTVSWSTRTNGGTDIGWGDGNADISIGNGEENLTHTYASAGTYTFKCRGRYKIFVVRTNEFQGKITQLKRLDNWKNEQDGGAWLSTSLGAETILRTNLEQFSNWVSGFTASTIQSGLSDLNITTSVPVTVAGMFDGATNWNDNISSWGVELVARGSLRFTFRNTSFNNSLSAWDVKRAASFQGVFSGSSFNQDLGDWEVIGQLYEGTNTSVSAGRLIDSTQSFGSFNINSGTLKPGDYVVNTTTGREARVTGRVSETELTLGQDIFTSVGDSYEIHIQVYPGGSPAARGLTFDWDSFCSNDYQNGEVLGPGTGWDRWDARWIQVFNRTFRFRPFGGGTEYTGTNTSVATNQLIDSGATFDTDEVTTSWTVFNLATNATALVTSVVDGQTLQLDADIFPSSSTNYAIHRVLYLDSWEPYALTQATVAWFGQNQHLSIGGWDFDSKKQTGSSTSVVANRLVDTAATFQTNNVMQYMYVRNVTNNLRAQVTSVVSETELILDTDIFTATGQRYIVFRVLRNFSQFCDTPRMNCGLYPGVAHTRVQGWDTMGFSNISNMFGSGWNGNTSNWNVTECLAIELPRGNYDLSNWERTTVGDESTVQNCTSWSNAARHAWNAGDAQGVNSNKLQNWNICSDPAKNVNFQNFFFQNGWFNQDIGPWNVSRVSTMRAMFFSASNFNCGSAYGVSHTAMNGWNTSNCSNFRETFRLARGFNGDISGWDVSNASNLQQMLQTAISWDQNIGAWTFQDGANAGTLANASGISDANVAACLTGWDVTGQGINVDASSWCANGNTPRTLAIATYPAANTAFDTLIASTGSGGMGWNMTGAITWV